MSVSNQHGRTGRLIKEDGSMINQADYLDRRSLKLGEFDFIRTTNLDEEVAKKNVDNVSITHKFGRNQAVGTSFVPITTSGTWYTATSNQSLTIVSDSASDTASGVGARTVSVTGTAYSGGNIIRLSEVVTLNGLTPVSLANQYRTIDRMFVINTGRYATSTPLLGSNVGTITVNNGADVWAEIAVNGLGKGQSQIACFTIPVGFFGLLESVEYTTEAQKSLDFLLMQRVNANLTTAPFGALRTITEREGVGSGGVVEFETPLYIDENTDIISLGEYATGSGSVTCDFEIKLYPK